MLRSRRYFPSGRLADHPAVLLSVPAAIPHPADLPTPCCLALCVRPPFPRQPSCRHPAVLLFASAAISRPANLPPSLAPRDSSAIRPTCIEGSQREPGPLGIRAAKGHGPNLRAAGPRVTGRRPVGILPVHRRRRSFLLSFFFFLFLPFPSYFKIPCSLFNVQNSSCSLFKIRRPVPLPPRPVDKCSYCWRRVVARQAL